MTEERRRAFDDKKTQSEPVGAGRVHSVKWPEDIRQLADRDADAVVANLEAYRRAAPAGSEPAQPAGRTALGFQIIVSSCGTPSVNWTGWAAAGLQAAESHTT